MFVLGDGHSWGRQDAQRRQEEPALSMVELSSSPRGITPLPSSGVIKYAANTIAIVDHTQKPRPRTVRASCLVELARD